MLYVDNTGITDARLNLALEEHVLRNRIEDDDLLLFYVNAPAIIIGRNQNTIEEINSECRGRPRHSRRPAHVGRRRRLP